MRKFLHSALDCAACLAGIAVGTAATGSVWLGFLFGIWIVVYGTICFTDGLTR